MRIRLLLSYLLITLIAVSAVVLLARQGAVSEVRAFMFPGGMVNIEELATSLESYYRQNGSWSGVESLLRPPGRRAQRGRAWGMSGMGQGMMMNQRLRLADVNGQVVFDSQSDEALGHLSPAEISTARPLRVDSQTVGYLLAQGGMAFSRADETFLLGRLTRAALLAGLVAAVLSLPLALMLTHTLMQPVRALTRAARRLGAGDLSQRVVARGNDELAELGQAFNRMAASLNKPKKADAPSLPTSPMSCALPWLCSAPIWKLYRTAFTPSHPKIYSPSWTKILPSPAWWMTCAPWPWPTPANFPSSALPPRWMTSFVKRSNASALRPISAESPCNFPWKAFEG